MQANDFCDICKKYVCQEELDWERWETTGKLVHKNCVRAQSSVKTVPHNVPQYPDKEIPSGLAEKILRDNVIRVKLIRKGQIPAPDIDDFDKDLE